MKRCNLHLFFEAVDRSDVPLQKARRALTIQQNRRLVTLTFSQLAFHFQSAAFILAALRLQSNRVSARTLMDFIRRDGWRVSDSLMLIDVDTPDLRRTELNRIVFCFF